MTKYKVIFFENYGNAEEYIYTIDADNKQDAIEEAKRKLIEHLFYISIEETNEDD